VQYINYLFFRFFTRIIGILPFSILYQISDTLSWLLRNVIKYRTDVTRQNLRNAFPNKTKDEIESIFRKSYSNLSDIIIEGIKGFYLSEEEVIKRYQFSHTEKVNSFYDKGKSVVLFASHYGNWEWAPKAVGHSVKHRSLGIVKLVKNEYINAFLQTNRCGKNVFLVDIAKTAKSIITYSDQPTQFVFLSDQGPTNTKKAHWIQFLNQNTPCLHGAERIARRKNWPVFNAKTTRLKRGYYETEFELLSENPSSTEEGEITEMYMRSLEQQIIAKPEDWLWSHKRWKRAHEDPLA